MKFKNVTRGKNAGEVVEYSAEEKVPVALQEALATREEHTGKYLTFIRDLTVTKVTYAARGELFKSKWQNNSYNAEGSATFHRRDIHRDVMLHPKKQTFSISFEDSLDTNGLPDFKVTSLDLAE